MTRLAILALLAGPLVCRAACPNTTNGYSYCREIDINSQQVSGTANLLNFPVLFIETNADFADTGNGGKVESSLGWDIRFELPDTTKLSHEIELYDNTTGQLIAWVRIPILEYGANTQYWVYYGKAGLGSSEEDIPGTWNSNYGAVLHLGEGDSEAADFYKDSTGNGNHATQFDNGNQILQDDGQIGKAMRFLGGTNASIRINDSATIEPLSGPVTLYAWAREEAASGDRSLLERNNWGPGEIALNWYNGSWQFQSFENTFFGHPDSDTTFFHQSVGTWVGTTGQTATYYFDGIARNTASWSNAISDTNLYWGIGNRPQNLDRRWIGVIDEVRIMRYALEADWIATEYNSHRHGTTGTFYTLGPEQTPGPPAGVPGRLITMLRDWLLPVPEWPGGIGVQQ